MNRKIHKNSLLSILLVLLLAIAALFGGCKGSENTTEAPTEATEATEKPTEAPTEPPTEAPTESPAEISERAMRNFLAKLSEGNYVMSVPDYLTTTVASRDQVLFDYADDHAYNDFVVMSVQNETFQALRKRTNLQRITYVTDGQAIEAAESRLVNYWASDEMSDGNIYNLFYNVTDEPLKFVSYDEGLKDSLRVLVGYGEKTLELMHEVYLVLDDEDPAVVHIQAEMDENMVARLFPDDIDLVISFGNAKSDLLCDAWMKDPIYPAARTEWTEADVFVFDSIFMPGFGKEAVPFMPFASYALTVDESNFVYNGMVEIRDAHATKENLNDYIRILEENGFEAVEEDGETWYRHLLREEYKCYSSIHVEYNDGLDFVAEKYYDFDTYEGLEAINEVIRAYDYLELPETSLLSDFTATDTVYDEIESWTYFYDFKLCLYVSAKYTDRDQVEAWLKERTDEYLAAGYHKVAAVAGEDTDEFMEGDYYEDPRGFQSFRYHFMEDNETVMLLYRVEKNVPEEEAEQIVRSNGFPEIDLAGYESCWDRVRFQKYQFGVDYEIYLSVTLPFENSADAEGFLNDYTAKLDAAGFMYLPPEKAGTNKNYGYYNEDTNRTYGFSLIDNDEGGKSINMDFIVFGDWRPNEEE